MKLRYSIVLLLFLINVASGFAQAKTFDYATSISLYRETTKSGELDLTVLQAYGHMIDLSIRAKGKQGYEELKNEYFSYLKKYFDQPEKSYDFEKSWVFLWRMCGYTRVWKDYTMCVKVSGYIIDDFYKSHTNLFRLYQERHKDRPSPIAVIYHVRAEAKSNLFGINEAKMDYLESIKLVKNFIDNDNTHTESHDLDQLELYNTYCEYAQYLEQNKQYGEAEKYYNEITNMPMSVSVNGGCCQLSEKIKNTACNGEKRCQEAMRKLVK